jgi:uncharacterized protein YgiM (DUF1202 family)
MRRLICFVLTFMFVSACRLNAAIPLPTPTWQFNNDVKLPLEPAPWPTPTPRRELLTLHVWNSTPAPGRCVVSATALNVRSGPDVSFPAVAWLSAGQEVTLLGDPGAKWLHVETTWKAQGWVNAAFVECVP